MVRRLKRESVNMNSNLTKLCKELIELRAKATPGEWENRCKEFSNTEKPRHIWDSTWGFIATCNSGSQDIVNAEFIAKSANIINKIKNNIVPNLNVDNDKLLKNIRDNFVTDATYEYYEQNIAKEARKLNNVWFVKSFYFLEYCLTCLALMINRL